jgi:uncharacterized protein YuzE
MTIRIGTLAFDHVVYDDRGDVLYLSVGKPHAAASTYATEEGHAVRFDESDTIIGITLVNAKWLAERDGKVTVTLPERIEASAEELAPALR